MILRPRNWKEFQHYTDRSPAWIKLHRGLLDNFEFHRLPDASRALAPMLWLLASESKDATIDADAEKLAFRLRKTSEWITDALKPLIDSVFFEVVEQRASKALAAGKQGACSEREERKRERQRKNPSAAAPPADVSHGTLVTNDWFVNFKLAYPERSGDYGWAKAKRAANARIAEGHTPEEFIAGAERYAKFCKDTDKTGTEFVKQAATFLGPDKPFLLPWTPPASKSQRTLDSNISAGMAFLAGGKPQ